MVMRPPDIVDAALSSVTQKGEARVVDLSPPRSVNQELARKFAQETKLSFCVDGAIKAGLISAFLITGKLSQPRFVPAVSWLQW